MWFIISIILHGILLLGGIFHWKTYEVMAEENVTPKISMSFSVKTETLNEKNIAEQPKAVPQNTVKPEEKKEKMEKPKEEIPKIEKNEKVKKIEKIEESVEIEPVFEGISSEVQEFSEAFSESTGVEKKTGFQIEGLTEVTEGVYVAQNQGVDGIEYKILFEQDPEYPIIAKRVGYKKPVEVEVKFLVGYDGKIEEIKFENEDMGMGFRNEVEKALKKWRFSPVTLKNQKIKMYFYKSFIFNQS